MKNEFFNRFQGLARSIAKRTLSRIDNPLPGTEVDDMAQEAMLSILSIYTPHMGENAGQYMNFIRLVMKRSIWKYVIRERLRGGTRTRGKDTREIRYEGELTPIVYEEQASRNHTDFVYPQDWTAEKLVHRLDLCPVNRLILRLYLVEGYIFDEIASLLNCSRQNVWKRFKTGLTHLRETNPWLEREL